jgi:hypothetical protein
MGSDLLHRVRWSNVARVVAAVAVVAAIVAWPRLGPPRPRVPAPGARPLVVAPVPTPTPFVTPSAAPRPRVVVRPRVVARRRVVLRRRRRAVRRRVVVPRRANPGIEGGGAAGSATRGGTVAPVAGGTSVTVPTPAPTRDPAQGEFGFER